MVALFGTPSENDPRGDALIGSAFAKQIVKEMKDRITGIFQKQVQNTPKNLAHGKNCISGDKSVRFKEYSAHDGSIVILLSALGMITNETTPRLHVGYANSVVFELRCVIFRDVLKHVFCYPLMRASGVLNPIV